MTEEDKHEEDKDKEGEAGNKVWVWGEDKAAMGGMDKRKEDLYISISLILFIIYNNLTTSYQADLVEILLSEDNLISAC